MKISWRKRNLPIAFIRLLRYHQFMPNLCIHCNEQEIWSNNEVYSLLGVCGQGCALQRIKLLCFELDSMKHITPDSDEPRTTISQVNNTFLVERLEIKNDVETASTWKSQEFALSAAGFELHSFELRSGLFYEFGGKS